MTPCDSVNCDGEGVMRIDGFFFCYKCYCEYKALNEMSDFDE